MGFFFASGLSMIGAAVLLWFNLKAALMGLWPSVSFLATFAFPKTE